MDVDVTYCYLMCIPVHVVDFKTNLQSGNLILRIKRFKLRNSELRAQSNY